MKYYKTNKVVEKVKQQEPKLIITYNAPDSLSSLSKDKKEFLSLIDNKEEGVSTSKNIRIDNKDNEDMVINNGKSGNGASNGGNY